MYCLFVAVGKNKIFTVSADRVKGEGRHVANDIGNVISPLRNEKLDEKPCEVDGVSVTVKTYNIRIERQPETVSSHPILIFW